MNTTWEICHYSNGKVTPLKDVLSVYPLLNIEDVVSTDEFAIREKTRYLNRCNTSKDYYFMRETPKDE